MKHEIGQRPTLTNAVHLKPDRSLRDPNATQPSHLRVPVSCGHVTRCAACISSTISIRLSSRYDDIPPNIKSYNYYNSPSQNFQQNNIFATPQIQNYKVDTVILK